MTATWADLSTARKLWRDAPADNEILALYLGAAQEAVTAYGETTEWTAVGIIPEGWQLAQILQARNIYNSGKASPGGDFDGSGYGLSAFPLDWQVRQLIRPQRAMGAIA